MITQALNPISLGNQTAGHWAGLHSASIPEGHLLLPAALRGWRPASHAISLSCCFSRGDSQLGMKPGWAGGQGHHLVVRLGW